jgi:hypothetical protein
MEGLTTVVVALNGVANACGRLLAPIGWLPGWLSATLIAIASGIAMLVIFKHTSNQRAIKRVRRSIRANLLAAKLFKDNIGLGLRSQGLVLLAALRLLLLAIVPILVMSIPVVLLWAQFGLWYQAAPIPVGEEVAVTVKLNGEVGAPMPTMELSTIDGIDDRTGPVRVFSERQVCWNLAIRKPGLHRLQFHIDGQTVEKELAAGDDFMPVSKMRPGWDWAEALKNPREEPFDRQSAVKSIEIRYPTRSSWTSGTDNWVIYWFVVAFVSGFCFRGLFKVNL